MKDKNVINSLYSAKNIILANIELQSNQKLLKQRFGINDTKYILNPNFTKVYSSWDLNKRNNSLNVVGGKGYFCKVRNFFEERID